MKKSKKDWDKIWLIVLLVVILLEISIIPCLVYSEVKRLLPVVFFLILPVACGIIVLLLSRNCTIDFQNKKRRLSKKI